MSANNTQLVSLKLSLYTLDLQSENVLSQVLRNNKRLTSLDIRYSDHQPHIVGIELARALKVNMTLCSFSLNRLDIIHPLETYMLKPQASVAMLDALIINMNLTRLDVGVSDPRIKILINRALKRNRDLQALT